MLYVVLPVYWREAGLSSLWDVGILLSLNRLARLPLNPVVGWLYSRLSTRTCALFASLLSVLVTCGYAFADGLFQWAILRVLWGLSWSLLKLGGLFTVMDVAENDNRGYLIGLYTGTYRIGCLVGMLGGGLMADLLNLRSTALACAALASVAFPMALFMLEHIPPSRRAENTSQSLSSLFALLRSPTLLWVLVTCLFVTLITEGFFMSTLSAMMELHWGESISCFGLAIGCATAAGIIQSLRWGWDPFLAPLVGRISDGPLGRVTMFAGSCWAAAIFFALIPAALPLLPWLGLLIGILLCCTAMTTLSDALATDVAADSQAVVVITAYTLAIDLGAALGPMGGYTFSRFWGMDAAYLAAAVLLALFAVKWTFSPPIRRQSKENSSNTPLP